MNGYERRKQQKKNKIRQAALELFQEFGPRQVTINQIAKKAGVSQVTIYNHFHSKDELVRDAVRYYYQQKYEEYKNIITSSASFHEKVEKIIFDKTVNLAGLNLEFLEELVNSDGELQAFINQYYQQKTLPLFVQLIEEGKKNGEVDPGIPIESVLFYLNVFRKGIEGYPVSYFFEEGERLLKDLITLFFYGVKGKR